MTNSLVMLVFKISDPLEKQLAQLRFWLAMIKAKQPPSETIGFAGECPHKPSVILVASFANLPTTDVQADESLGEGVTSDEDPPTSPRSPNLNSPSTLGPPSAQPAQVLDAVREEFGRYFNFSERVFELDCRLSQTNEMKAVRHHLGTLRCNLIQVGVVGVISRHSREICAVKAVQFGWYVDWGIM